jgi:hypothetical protein
VVFCKLFWTDKHRRICEVFSLPRSFWFYEWSRSNHYTSSIIPLCGTQFGKINLRNIRGFADFFEFNIHALALGILTVLIYYLIPLLTKAIPSALAALIIGALTAIFWDGTCPLLEKFHLEFQIYRWNPIQYYTTRSIHLNSRICRRAVCWVVLTPYLR